MSISMTYKLRFKRQALKEWHKLDPALKRKLKRVLARRLEEPRVASSRLRGMPDCYKIKLRKEGYRLVYRIVDTELVVEVIAVAPRTKDLVYKIARSRL